MKFDKWTVVLAAAGVVSFTSVALAEEKPSTLGTALSATTISGFVDTSAEWNFGTGNKNVPPVRFNGASKADGFNLDVVQLRIEKPLDETPWSAGYRVDLWFGPDANTLGTQSYFGGGTQAGTGDFAIRQAYVTLNMPILNGLDWKVGVFDSIIGYEPLDAASNPNFTRSYGHSFEPTTHTGALATYHFGSVVSVSAGVANTLGPIINERAQGGLNPAGATEAESYKSYMGSVAITAPDSMGFLAGSTLYGGVVNGFNGNVTPNAATATGDNQTSYYAGATIKTPLTGLTFGSAFDYRNVYGISGDTWSFAVYSSYQATEKLSFHARGEYLSDRAGYFNLGPTDTVLAMTGTVQYDLWKNVISRVELRWDHSLNDKDAFGGDTAGTPDRKNAFLLAANLIYKF